MAITTKKSCDNCEADLGDEYTAVYLDRYKKGVGVRVSVELCAECAEEHCAPLLALAPSSKSAPAPAPAPEAEQ